MAIRKGTKVRWKYGDSYAFGKVEKSFPTKVTLDIKGISITRHGCKENRVLLIRQENGKEVVKLLYEVEREF